jgi:hypothetical protein
MGSVGSGKAVDAGSLNTSPYIALRIDRSQHRGSFECVGLLLRLLLGSAVHFLMMRRTTFTSAQPDTNWRTKRSSIGDTVCARTCTRRRGQLALLASIAPSVPRISRPRSGDVPSRVSRSLRKQAHSKPRCRVRRHRKSITNARRSPSSRTPGFKSDVGSVIFVAEGKRKQAWKLSGHVLVTT